MAVAVGQMPKRHVLFTHPLLAGSALLLIATTAVSLFALLLLGGDNPAVAPAPAPAVPGPLSVSEQDMGCLARLASGDRLEVTLQGNPTTGYTWEVAAGDPAVLAVVGEPEFVADSGALGSGGQVVTRFAAVGAGQTTLRMIYHRPFEPGVAPLKTFELIVVVEKTTLQAR
jgi:inhibitor of cysteine peptidase